MRLLFLSDFHGHLPDLASFRADVLVAGGDYCEVDEIRQLKFAALQRGWKALHWPELIGRRRAEELVERALAEGSAVVSALADCGLPVLAIPGNSDRVGEALGPLGTELLARCDPRPDRPAVAGRITNLEGRLVLHGGVAFAGLGGWSGTESAPPLRAEVVALHEQWQALCSERHARGLPPPPLVLVSHNVPHGSHLDGVDNPELPPFAQGLMVGSHRCREALAALSPLLCLSGHLHENYGRTERIGTTLCVNGAGAYRGDAVLVDVTPESSEAGEIGAPLFVTAPAGAARLMS